MDAHRARAMRVLLIVVNRDPGQYATKEARNDLLADLIQKHDLQFTDRSQGHSVMPLTLNRYIGFVRNTIRSYGKPGTTKTGSKLDQFFSQGSNMLTDVGLNKIGLDTQEDDQNDAEDKNNQAQVEVPDTDDPDEEDEPSAGKNSIPPESKPPKIPDNQTGSETDLVLAPPDTSHIDRGADRHQQLHTDDAASAYTESSIISDTEHEIETMSVSRKHEAGAQSKNRKSEDDHEGQKKLKASEPDSHVPQQQEATAQTKKRKSEDDHHERKKFKTDEPEISTSQKRPSSRPDSGPKRVKTVHEAESGTTEQGEARSSMPISSATKNASQTANPQPNKQIAVNFLDLLEVVETGQPLGTVLKNKQKRVEVGEGPSSHRQHTVLLDETEAIERPEASFAAAVQHFFSDGPRASWLATTITGLGDGEIQRTMEYIWGNSNALSAYLMLESGAEMTVPAKWDHSPSAELVHLYKQLYGTEYNKTIRTIDQLEQQLAYELVGALIATAVYQWVFDQPLPWKGPKQTLANLSEEAESMKLVLNAWGKGKCRNLEAVVWEAARTQIMRPEFQEETISPMAGELADKLIAVLGPQLRILGIRKKNNVPGWKQYWEDVHSKLKIIFFDALRLKGLMEVSPCYYSFEWPPYGTRFDRMTTDSTRTGDGERHVIYTVLPRVWAQESKQHEHRLASRAMVSVKPTTDDEGNRVSEQPPS